MARIRDELRELLKTHVISLKTDGQYIVDQLSGDYPNLVLLTAHTHKLKGSSGTAGFRQLHDVSQILHDLITERAKHTHAVDSACLEVAHRLKALLDELTVDQSELLSRSTI